MRGNRAYIIMVLNCFSNLSLISVDSMLRIIIIIISSSSSSIILMTASVV